MYDEITQVGMNKLIIFVSDPHGYHRKTYFNRPMLISNQDNKIIRQALKKNWYLLFPTQIMQIKKLNKLDTHFDIKICKYSLTEVFRHNSN